MSSANSLRAKAFGSGAPRAAVAGSAASGKPTGKSGATKNSGAAKAATAQEAAPIAIRLRAWWHGIDAADLLPPPEPEPQAAQAAQAAEAAPEEAAETEADFAAWSEARLKAAEIVVGDDCRSPIGPDLVVETLKPLGLSNAKAMLDVSAGLGNAARKVAATYGAWVSGLESSSVLAQQGMARSTEEGVAKKVPIIHADLEDLKKPEKAFDCVYGREAFYTVRNKSGLLKTLVEALKPGGELVFTDYMLRTPDSYSTVVQEWLAGEPLTPHMWSVEQLIVLLRELRLDVRVTEDYSKPFRDLIVKRLEMLVTKNDVLTADPAQAEQLLHEVELWGRRVKALDGGDVQVFRVFARKTGSADGKIRAMSNW